MKRSKRLFAVVLSLAVAFAFFPLVSMQADAETLTDYNAAKAVKFAKNNTKNYKDCVKFVRMCAEKGGVPAQAGRNYEYTPEQYMDYLMNEGYAVRSKLTLCEDATVSTSGKYGNLTAEDNVGKLAKGDLLIYKCKKCGKYFHMAILTGTDMGAEDDMSYWLLCAQSANGQMIKNLPFYCYEHSGHGRSKVEVYVLHFTSSDNGFKACTKKVKSLKAKKVTTKKARLSWKKVTGAVAYNIYVRGYEGGPVEFVKQVKGTSAKVAIPKNSKGKYYNYKNVKFTVAPVVKKKVTFDGVKKTYKVVGKKCSMVNVK